MTESQFLEEKWKLELELLAARVREKAAAAELLVARAEEVRSQFPRSSRDTDL